MVVWLTFKVTLRKFVMYYSCPNERDYCSVLLFRSSWKIFVIGTTDSSAGSDYGHII